MLVSVFTVILLLGFSAETFEVSDHKRNKRDWLDFPEEYHSLFDTIQKNVQISSPAGSRDPVSEITSDDSSKPTESTSAQDQHSASKTRKASKPGQDIGPDVSRTSDRRREETSSAKDSLLQNGGGDEMSVTRLRPGSSSKDRSRPHVSDMADSPDEGSSTDVHQENPPASQNDLHIKEAHRDLKTDRSGSRHETVLGDGIRPNTNSAHPHIATDSRRDTPSVSSGITPDMFAPQDDASNFDDDARTRQRVLQRRPGDRRAALPQGAASSFDDDASLGHRAPGDWQDDTKKPNNLDVVDSRIRHLPPWEWAGDTKALIPPSDASNFDDDARMGHRVPGGWPGVTKSFTPQRAASDFDENIRNRARSSAERLRHPKTRDTLGSADMRPDISTPGDRNPSVEDDDKNARHMVSDGPFFGPRGDTDPTLEDGGPRGARGFRPSRPWLPSDQSDQNSGTRERFSEHFMDELPGFGNQRLPDLRPGPTRKSEAVPKAVFDRTNTQERDGRRLSSDDGRDSLEPFTNRGRWNDLRQH